MKISNIGLFKTAMDDIVEICWQKAFEVEI
jgi:hypothetical protein